MRFVTKPLLAACLTAFLGAIGCGADTGFEGASDKKSQDGTSVNPAPVPKQPVAAPTSQAYSSLTWFWPCESAPVTPPTANSLLDPVIVGEGPHTLDKTRMDGTPVKFMGNMCQPEQMPRDIVLVIDTSGSMAENDPRASAGCGRLAAVEAVLDQVLAANAGGAGRARVGLVTFGSSLDLSSSALFDAKASLVTDVTGITADTLADVVCAASSGTNYDAGLIRAQALLATGRVGATKEIYFVSDGQPDAGNDGILIADSLKTTGINVGTDFITATIATVMLAGNDTVLENSIASRDPDGKPLHAYVANTAQLTKVLADLTANDIVSGWLRYRALGDTGVWTTLDLETHMQGFNFELPSVNIDAGAAPGGLEVFFEYWDKHDNRYSTRGKLLWNVDGSTGS